MVQATDTRGATLHAVTRPYAEHPAALLRARIVQTSANISANIDQLSALRTELALRSAAIVAEPVLPDPPEHMTVIEAGIGHWTIDCRCGAHWSAITQSMARDVLGRLAKTHHGLGRCEQRWPDHAGIASAVPGRG